jgi:hypothetical protein
LVIWLVIWLASFKIIGYIPLWHVAMIPIYAYLSGLWTATKKERLSQRWLENAAPRYLGNHRDIGLNQPAWE